MTKLKTPEEVWYSRNPCHDFDDNGKDRFYGTAFMCMTDYAKQQVLAFQEWTNLNGWFWAPNRWMNYHGDPDPKSTEELYTLFLQSLELK